MPAPKKVLPRAHDKVKCKVCGRTIERRNIKTHWKTINNKNNWQYHDPNIPMDCRVDEIIPKSNLLSMWKKKATTKRNNTITSIQPNDIQSDMDIVHDDEDTKAMESSSNDQQQQLKISDMCKKIEKELIERDKLMSDTEYLISCMNGVLDMINDTNICR